MEAVFILVFVTILSSSVNCVVVKDELYRLDVIHYNDFHARFEETTADSPVCVTNDTKCIGGFSRMYHEIKAVLNERPDALLLNAGDVFQGTYWYTMLKWEVSQKFINLLPIDAHALGNHEFDDGLAGLVPYLEALHAPVVIANLDASKEPSMNGLYNASIILERNGRKIGIIGLTTPDTALTSNAGGLIFLDPSESLQKEAEKLKRQGVDIIIVLSHCGLKVDRDLALTVGEDIDIIVGGHSHSLLWNGLSPTNEEVSGPYPILIESQKKQGHKVLIVTAASFSKYLGNVTIFFDSKGEMVDFEGTPIFLNRTIPEDPEIKKLLQPHNQRLHALVNEVVGFSHGDLLLKYCGSRECAIGDLTADSFLDAAKEKNISQLPHVAFLLRNMIRGSMTKGNISRGAIVNCLPLSNEVVSIVLPGKYLKEALEYTLMTSWELHPFNGPWLPQIAGFHLTLNSTSKHAEVLVKEHDGLQPLDPEKEYQVTTLSFLLKGGNGFKMLSHGKNKTFIGKDCDILESYIRKISTINYTLDNRLAVIS